MSDPLQVLHALQGPSLLGEMRIGTRYTGVTSRYGGGQRTKTVIRGRRSEVGKKTGRRSEGTTSFVPWGSRGVTPSQVLILLIEIEIGAVTCDVTEGHKRGKRSEIGGPVKKTDRRAEGGGRRSRGGRRSDHLHTGFYPSGRKVPRFY